MLRDTPQNHIAKPIDKKSEWKRAMWLSLIVLLSFLLYLILIGIPKTNARNIYNRYLVASDLGYTELSIDFLIEAYSIWPEEYIYKEKVRLGLE